MNRASRYYIYIYVCFTLLQVNGGIHPDVNLTLEGYFLNETKCLQCFKEQRVTRHGYPHETHEVTTDDGYILSLYRIPYGLEKPQDYKNRSVVLLMHGLGSLPNYWVALGPKDSMAYYFADRGFDVWLLSARGVEGSTKRKHVKWDWNKDKNYWKFSMHEIGFYDLKAHIDYVTAHTNQSKVFYVGHSAGVIDLLILLSERPEYNEKIKIGALQGSVPILKRIDYPLSLLMCSLLDLWKGITRYLNMVEFLPQLQELKSTIKSICSNENSNKLCYDFLGIIGSHSPVLVERDLTGLIFADQPSRMSVSQFIFYMENVNKGDFRQLDHGRKLNLKYYGQEVPPRYNLSRCTAPVAIFYGRWDGLLVKSDVYEAINNIPRVIMEYEIPVDKFTHIDFIFARNATNLVYEPTYKLFRDYDKGIIPEVVGPKIIPDEDVPTVY